MVGEVPLGEVPEVNFVFSFHKLAKGTSHGPKRMELKNLPPVTIYVHRKYTVRGSPLLLCPYGPWSSGQAI
jgi:hypothetical protein